MAGIGAGAVAANFLGSVKAIAADVKRVLIRNIETFDIQMPQSASIPPVELFGGAQRGRLNVVRVETDSGVRGYSFLGSSPEQVKAATAVLGGQDLFAVEAHLKKGLIQWAAIEEAMWDAIGRIAGQQLAFASGRNEPASERELPVPDIPREELLPKAVAFGGHHLQLSLQSVGFHGSICQAVALVAQAGYIELKLNQMASGFFEQLRQSRQFIVLSGDFRLVIGRKLPGLVEI